MTGLFKNLPSLPIVGLLKRRIKTAEKYIYRERERCEVKSKLFFPVSYVSSQSALTAARQVQAI